MSLNGVMTWFGDYPSETATDPTGPESGRCRVIRGGSFGITARYCRSATRGLWLPGSRSRNLGFRLVRS